MSLNVIKNFSRQTSSGLCQISCDISNKRVQPIKETSFEHPKNLFCGKRENFIKFSSSPGGRSYKQAQCLAQCECIDTFSKPVVSICCLDIFQGLSEILFYV